MPSFERRSPAPKDDRPDALTTVHTTWTVDTDALTRHLGSRLFTPHIPGTDLSYLPPVLVPVEHPLDQALGAVAREADRLGAWTEDVDDWEEWDGDDDEDWDEDDEVD